jgi:hypothetical protein
MIKEGRIQEHLADMATEFHVVARNIFSVITAAFVVYI